MSIRGCSVGVEGVNTASPLLENGSTTEEGVLSLSRGTSIILLIIYLLYLFFQLRTHCDRFDPAGLDSGGECRRGASGEHWISRLNNLGVGCRNCRFDLFRQPGGLN